jgi:hypothetical protein
MFRLQAMLDGRFEEICALGRALPKLLRPGDVRD